MRQIHDHAQLLHLREHLAAQIRQATAIDAMHGTGDLVVEEVREPGHPRARVIQALQIRSIALQVVQPLQGVQGADGIAAGLALGHQRLQIPLRPDPPQLPVRPLDRPIQLLRVIHRPLER